MRRLKKKRKPAARKDVSTEQKILDAAHVVFVRRGSAGARMQEIAAEAGVNQALLHYYFRTKEHLAKAAFERAAMQLMPAVVRIIAQDGELEDKKTGIDQVYLAQMYPAPYLPRVIVHAG